jgi:O-antigen biosynthesis protein WbqP
MIKRVFDLIITIIASLIFAPLAFVIAIMIKLESSGPAVISTLRIGKDGALFAHCRFRTMVGKPPKKHVWAD